MLERRAPAVRILALHVAPLLVEGFQAEIRSSGRDVYTADDAKTWERNKYKPGMPSTPDVISLETVNRGDARRLVVTRDQMRVSLLSRVAGVR